MHDAPTTARKQRRDRSVSRDAVPTIVYERPRCPSCSSTRLRAGKSVTDADGVVTRDSRCRDCGERVFVIAE